MNGPFGHTARVNAVAVTTISGRPSAITAHDEGTVGMWDLTSNQLANSLFGHTDRVKAVAVTAIRGRPYAITGGSDGTLRVWDLTTNQQTATLEGHTRQVRAIAATQLDGRPHAITSGDGHTIRVWDLTTNQQTTILTGHTGVVCALATAELNGRPHAIAGRSNGTVRVWDLTANEQTATLTGHTGPVRALAVVELDGRPHALTGGDDGTIRIWDLVDFEALAEFQISNRPISSVATFVTDEGPHFLTGGDDGVLRVWDLHALLTVSTTGINEEFNGEDTGTADRLRRGDLVAHLITRLGQLADNSRSPSSDAGDLTGSGIVHIDGRWGAGKTTFIEIVLKSWNPVTKPLVVRYDAWRQSAIAPEWWSLASETRRAIHRERAIPTRAIMAAGGFLRRLFRSTSTWVAVAVAALAGLGIWLVSGPAELPKQVDIATKVLTLMTGLLTIAFVVTRSLFWSAPVFGRLHIRTDDNPLAEISSVVGHLRRWSPRSGVRHRLAERLLTLCMVVTIPAAIWGIPQEIALALHLSPGTGWRAGFILAAVLSLGAYGIFLAVTRKRPRRMVLLIIDDLDRCEGTRVVRLLETVHTVLRDRAAPRGLFKNYRKPAPLGVLVLANGAWIRAAFSEHYATFDRRGDNDVHDLGADFVQKIFDHSILVPASSPEQTEELVRYVSNSHHRQFLTPRVALPESSSGVIQPSEDLDKPVAVPPELSEPGATIPDPPVASTPPEAASENAATISALVLVTSTPVTVPPDGPVEEGASPSPAATWESTAARDDPNTNESRRINHLLTNYPSILPRNPRLIIRVATSWSMLQAVGRSLRLEVDGEPANDLLVRAAVAWVRFPVLVDLLLDADEPPIIDPTNEKCDPRWRRRDVQRVLRRDDGGLINIEDLARYYGKFFDPAVPGPQHPTPAAATGGATTP